MNVERLYSAVLFLREKDSDLGIQSKLNQLVEHLGNLSSQPQHPQHQNNVASALSSLENAIRAFESQVTPAQKNLIQDIGGTEFFSFSLVEDVKTRLLQNNITPAVVFESTRELKNRREKYLGNLEKLQQDLSSIGVQQEAGLPELGILIPRNLFNNHLGSLATELGTLHRIIRLFCEVTTGTAQPVQVGQISSSDPTFFLGAPVVALLAVAKAVDWLVEKWKEIEEIRKVRAETANLGIEAALKPFDDRIEATVKESIDKQVQQLLSQSGGDSGRKNELEIGLSWALKSLLARIERGMTVEVRFIAPPPEASAAEEATYKDLSDVGRRLQFVQVAQGQPVLTLPPPEPPKDATQA